jgi:nucleoside-diphosphate-sugar epimerase
MSAKSYLITGGTGFIGSALVRRLVGEGHRVRVLDNQSRGSNRRLEAVAGAFELVEADIRDSAAVHRALRGVDGVFHLAAVNGTEFFYSKPEIVLEVAVKGIVHVIDGCLSRGIGELFLASSSEVYQTPPAVPTDESVPLSVPDPLNPRYSYGGGKIISELLALNYGRRYFERVVVFRPHNVYGPDMGWEHVIPQFALRMKELSRSPENPLPFPIQGTGGETRAFVFIEDFIDGLMILRGRGEHLGIYHIGTRDEVRIGTVAELVGEAFGRRVRIVAGELARGGTPRRCPDIAKITTLGYRPKIPLREGISITAEWYDRNAGLAPGRGTAS